MNYRKFIANAFAKWFSTKPFTTFLTLTFRPMPYYIKLVPQWFSGKIDSHLRKACRATRSTFGAMGVMTVGCSGHLHTHLLVLEKSGRPLDDYQLAALSDWPYQSEATAVYDLPQLSEYIASDKHLNYSQDAEFYAYGAKTMEIAARHAAQSGDAHPASAH